MKVVLRNPSKELIIQVQKKEGIVLEFTDLAEREDELLIEDIIDIKDLSRVAFCDFAIYKEDAVIYLDNSDFSSMEVQL